MLIRRGGEKPEIGQLKELKCSSTALADIVERQALKGWHIADGRHGSDDLRDQFRKAASAVGFTDVGAVGGAKEVTPAGSVSVSIGSTAAGGSVSIGSTAAGGSVSVSISNHTLSTSQIPSHNHSATTGDNEASYGYFGTQGIYTARTYSTDSTGGGGGHNHGASASFSGTSHGHTASFSGATHGHTSSGGFTGNVHTNEPQFIVVLLLQYTGVKVAGVTP
jgi:hypothetical protein